MDAGRDGSAPGRWLPPPPRSPVVLAHDLPLPTAAPHPPVPARRARRAPLAVVAVLVSVLAVVLAGSAWTQYANSHGAAAAARGYFQALAAGDAAGALAFAAGPPPAQDGTYLTDRVLAEQLKIAPISSFSVLGSSDGGGGRTVVTVRYTLGFDKSQQVVQDSVPMIRHGRSWRLERVAVHVTVQAASAGADRLTFAGRPLPSTEVLVFPGALPIRTDLDAVTVRKPAYAALSQEHADIQVAGALSDTATKQLDDAVQAAVEKCLAPASNDPLCPQVQSVRQVPGSLHGTLSTGITQTNAVVSLDSGNGLVTFDGNASINATYKIWDFNNIEQPRSEQVTVPLHVLASVADLSKVYWAGSNG